MALHQLLDVAPSRLKCIHAFLQHLVPFRCEIELPPLHWSAGQLRDWMLKVEERFASEKAKAAARREASAAAGVAACVAR